MSPSLAPALDHFATSCRTRCGQPRGRPALSLYRAAGRPAEEMSPLGHAAHKCRVGTTGPARPQPALRWPGPRTPASRPQPAPALSAPASSRANPLVGRLVSQPLVRRTAMLEHAGCWAASETLPPSSSASRPRCLWVRLKQSSNESLFIHCIPPRVTYESLSCEV